MTTVGEEIGPLRSNLSKSQESYILLGYENGDLAGELTRAKKDLQESRREMHTFCS